MIQIQQLFLLFDKIREIVAKDSDPITPRSEHTISGSTLSSHSSAMPLHSQWSAPRV